MRALIHILYTVLLFITVFVLSFTTSYYAWYLSGKYKINLVGNYFDIFPSTEHYALITAIILFFISPILKFSEKQAIYFYKNYVERTVYLKYFFLNFSLYFVSFVGISMVCWVIFNQLQINILNNYYDKPLSIEHYMTAFMMTVFAYKPLIKKSKKITEKVFFQYYETKGRHISAETRAYVKKRDKGKCKQCNSKRKLEYDHIKPYAKGGSNRAYNIQLLCMKCNREKSDAY